jgi:hypothetical protein
VQNSYNTIVQNDYLDKVMVAFTMLKPFNTLTSAELAVYNDVKQNFYQSTGGSARIGWQFHHTTTNAQMYESWCTMAAPLKSDWLEAGGGRWSENGNPTQLQDIYNDPTCGATNIADLNSDGTVNILDLSILLVDWATSDAQSDINSDGTVNILDLSIMLSNWG